MHVLLIVPMNSNVYHRHPFRTLPFTNTHGINRTDIHRHYSPTPLYAPLRPLPTGVIPYGAALDNPSMLDFENLFDTQLIGGASKRLNHYNDIQIVATGLRRFLEKLQSNNYNRTLFFTHPSRIDIILGFLSHAKVHKERHGEDFQGAMVVAGESPDQPGGGAPQESEHVMHAIKAADVPVLYVPFTTYKAMEMVRRPPQETGDHHRKLLKTAR